MQDFLLKLGKGFCFEARQKRMIIDDEYYFADLVFYNRILYCNVIIELKNDEFRHADLSQLNSYVSYFRENEMHEGDNPPVGILLCTRKGKKMVEYALAGLDNKIFVSTYMLALPDTKVLEDFLCKEIFRCKFFCREAALFVFEKNFCGCARIGERVVVVKLNAEIVAKAVELFRRQFGENAPCHFAGAGVFNTVAPENTVGREAL